MPGRIAVLLVLAAAMLGTVAGCTKPSAKSALPASFHAGSAQQPGDPYWFESIDVVKVDSGPTAWHYEARIRNEKDYGYAFSVRLEYLDAGGQMVHEHLEYSIIVPPKGEKLWAGMDHIPEATAVRIVSVRGVFH
jgi:hypothetical protein